MAPLSKCITHQHQKTRYSGTADLCPVLCLLRAAAVQALGDLVMATDGGVFELSITHIAQVARLFLEFQILALILLTQRTFDPSPVVRRTVIKVLGAWLQGFPDRYSYFHQV